jgi:DNA-binding NarL/FixJ family response regulator
MTTSRSTVVVADDHPLILRSLADLIGAAPDFALLDSVSDGELALQAIRSMRPELAVLDVNMPKLSGIDVMHMIMHDAMRTRVVFLTAEMAPEQVLDAIAADVQGIVLKESAPETLLDCMRAVRAGGKWIPETLVEAALASETRKRETEQMLDSSLTPREVQIMQLAATGLPNKSIGRQLSVSEGTVKLHLHNIYRKLGITNRTELAALAAKLSVTGGARR